MEITVKNCNSNHILVYIPGFLTFPQESRDVKRKIDYVGVFVKIGRIGCDVIGRFNDRRSHYWFRRWGKLPRPARVVSLVGRATNAEKRFEGEEGRQKFLIHFVNLIFEKIFTLLNQHIDQRPKNESFRLYLFRNLLVL